MKKPKIKTKTVQILFALLSVICVSVMCTLLYFNFSINIPSQIESKNTNIKFKESKNLNLIKVENASVDNLMISIEPRLNVKSIKKDKNASIDNLMVSINSKFDVKSIKKDKNIEIIKTRIIKINKKYKIAKIKKFKGVKGLYSINIGNNTFYTDSNADYIIPVIASIDDLMKKNKEQQDQNKQTKQNQSRSEKIISNKINKFPKKGLVTYRATDEKGEIFVFSDYTCPFCKKFHNSILNINKMGLTIHYIPFPRNGMRDKMAVIGLQNILCSENPALEFGKAFQTRKTYYKKISPLTYNCKKASGVIEASIVLADQLKIKGTPSIYSKNGVYLGGWTGIKNFEFIYKKLITEKQVNYGT